MIRRLSRDRLAVLAAIVVPLAVAAILVPFRSSIPNTDAALAMILVVVAVAANGYRLAGILAALSVAVWFDFFLTQPYETFSITRRTDIETTVLLLVIGIAVTEIAVWGRRQRLTASRRAGYLDGINSAAQAVAAGGSASALIEQVTRPSFSPKRSRCRPVTSFTRASVSASSASARMTSAPASTVSVVLPPNPQRSTVPAGSSTTSILLPKWLASCLR